MLDLAHPARLALLLAVTAGVAGGLFAVLQARLLSRAIGAAFLQGWGVDLLAPLLGSLLAVVFGRAATVFVMEAATQAAARRVKSTLRRSLIEHLTALGPAHTRRERTGELAAVCMDGVESLEAYYGQYLPQLALAALLPLVVLAVVFPLDGLSGLVLLLTGPLIPAFMVLIGRLAERSTRRQWQTLARLSAHFLDTLQGLETLKLLGRSREQAGRLRLSSERYRLASMDVLRVTFLSALALEWLATISTALVAVQLGLRLLAGQVQYVDALTVLVLAPEFYLPLRNLALRFHAGQSGLSAAHRILDLLEQPTPESRTAAPTVEKAAGKHRPGLLPPVHFDAVSYTYPGAEHSVLSGVTFDLLPGEHVALVGSSGAGKSTIAQLLLAFLQPASGQIRVGDRRLAGIAPGEWRACLAWVPEKPHIFYGTLAENIALGKAGASRDEIRQAAGQAGLLDWIDSLPDGFDTLTGEGGGKISAGQAQRVALARAFLRQAPLLILDEPTASLDPQLEAELTDVVRRLAQGCTVLTIAHRLSTVQQADRIIVLEQGVIVEQGSHARLLAAGGVYSRLVKAYFGADQ